jgi:hypothetical protein
MWLVEAGPFSRDDGVRWDPGTNVSKPPQPFRAIGDDAKEDFPSSARTTSLKLGPGREFAASLY